MGIGNDKGPVNSGPVFTWQQKLYLVYAIILQEIKHKNRQGVLEIR